MGSERINLPGDRSKECSSLRGAMRFSTETGPCIISARHVDSKGFGIGEWVSSQRADDEEGILSAFRFDEEEPDCLLRWFVQGLEGVRLHDLKHTMAPLYL